MILAWTIVLLVLIAPYPTIRWLVGHSPLPTSKGLVLLVSIGFGIGTLTWLMMLEGTLGIPFQLWTILLPYLLVLVPGSVLWWRGRQALLQSAPEVQPARLALLGRVVVLGVGAAVLLNALYWPFYKADAVGIYAEQAHFMYATAGLIPLKLTFYSYYQAYPMLVQLSYTFTYFASGSENPYLAKFIAALLSLACLGAVYYLGKTLYNSRVGWLAVLLLALAPLFGRWASSGYADLPMAFFYTVAALFAWRAWESNHAVDALMSGAALGFGAWTKNAILPAVAFWSAFMLLGFLRKRMSMKAVVLACCAGAIIAVPWYIRNLVEAYLLIPATAWIDQANPNLSNLLVLITHPENFAFTGWLVALGIVVAVVQLVRHPREANREILLLVYTLPYFGFWWLLASYDRRFLLYYLPILVVLGAKIGIDLWERIPKRYHSGLGWMLAVMTLGLMVYVASISIDFKRDLLRDPLMSEASKYAIVTSKPYTP